MTASMDKKPGRRTGPPNEPTTNGTNPAETDTGVGAALTELALRRAWRRISQGEYDVQRNAVLGLAPGAPTPLRERWAKPRARADHQWASTPPQPPLGDNGPSLQESAAELALHRAWGRIDKRTLEFERARLLSQAPPRVQSRAVHVETVAEPAADARVPRSVLWTAAEDGATWTPVWRERSRRGWLGVSLEWSRLARTAERWLRTLIALPRSAVRSRDIVVAVPMLAVVGVLQATNMLHWPGVYFDEGTYVSWAWAFQAHGALGTHTYTYGHPPLAWIAVSVWTWVGGLFGHGTFSIDNAREFMLAVSLITCSLLYILARRLGMSRPFAAGAVLLFGLSPLAVFFHRLVLLDNPEIAWTLAAFVLALTPKRRLWAFAASGACFAFAVLSKETILVVFPALLLAAAQNTDRRTRRYCLTLFICFFSVITLVFPLYAALKGELLPGPGHVSLLNSLIFQLVVRKATGSVFDPQSLAHGTVAYWLHFDPWLVGVALLLSLFALTRRHLRAAALAYLIQVAVILRPGYLPSMYVIGLLPFSSLIVAGSAEFLWRKHRQAWHRARFDHRPTRVAAEGSRLRTARSWATSGVTTVMIVASVVGGGFVARGWVAGDQVATTVRLDDSERAAEQWLVQHVNHQQRVIAGDDFWIYLVEHGFDAQPVRGGFYSRTIEPYWQVDHDPAVQQFFTHGWRDFDYIVSTQEMRDNTDDNPSITLALQHSRPVVSFGHGIQLIEVRQINAAGA